MLSNNYFGVVFCRRWWVWRPFHV